MARALRLADLFAALADDTRLRILSLLAGQEVCVCFFVQALQAPQPKISRHLAFLRRAGLLQARREGKWMHYSISPPADASARQILEATLDAIAPRFRDDRRRLKSACCGPRSLVETIGAPAPSQNSV